MWNEMWNADLYGLNRMPKFHNVYPNVDTFLSDYADFNGTTALTNNSISNASAEVLYYLLIANYSNSTIAPSDINRFKYRLFSIIFSYGPTWEKRLDLQQKIRALTEQELLKGGKAIYNTALNPATQVSTAEGQTGGTQTTEELAYINSQNTTNYTKSKAEALAIQLSMLTTDVTEDFIRKFRRLFLQIGTPEMPLWYITKTDPEDENDGN